jgi:hypothetical protein
MNRLTCDWRRAALRQTHPLTPAAVTLPPKRPPSRRPEASATPWLWSMSPWLRLQGSAGGQGAQGCCGSGAQSANLRARCRGRAPQASHGAPNASCASKLWSMPPFAPKRGQARLDRTSLSPRHSAAPGKPPRALTGPTGPGGGGCNGGKYGLNDATRTERFGRERAGGVMSWRWSSSPRGALSALRPLIRSRRVAIDVTLLFQLFKGP